ncbi:DegV domain-containing protein [Clostridium tepidiprofundi DSM 19306]|uniref:DegV domain-containing protein n=1 Tax=Clostridium tepidiprofundi DSM 19306 TaxID=1121338 RepID=A0A151B318_9CLOT|nr:DegV family protein [Clostridium tepidiprofundi]KYH34173.1 DegV domain-containing protein [Clostridium tepidiprofundi DSM 19306]
MGIKIITDSTSYIPKEFWELFDITVISLSVIFEDETFKELEVDNDYFYNKLKNSTTMPTSSQPSIEELYNIFEKEIKNGNKIVAVFISSGVSGTYQSALLVKDMILENYPHAEIEVIDSKTICMQLGYAVLSAAKAAKSGNSMEEVVNSAKTVLKRSRFIFIPDTLEYLKRGGRIGEAQALIGKIMQIKPILTYSKGKVAILSKVRTKKKALMAIIDIMLNDVKEHGLNDIIVHHINDEDEAIKFAKIIEKKIGRSVEICDIGPIVGLHVGPGALGIAYTTQSDLCLE